MWNDKVIWSEGLFLQPQHFQQQDRYFERLVEARASVIAGERHGFAVLTLDEGAQAVGKVAIVRARGVFPDGTVFDTPAVDPPPAPLVIDPDVRGERIYLAVTERHAGQQDAAFIPDDAAAFNRFRVTEFDAVDSIAPERSATIQIGRLQLRLVRERDLTGAFSALGACRVTERRVDRTVVIDTDYIPPALSVRDQPALAGYARELLGILRQRSESVAQSLGQAGAGGVGEIVDFLLLQTLNRYEPLFAHLADAAMLHPERLYSVCLMLVGDLAALSRESRRTIPCPPYQHDDLERTFPPLMADLRRLLLAMRERRAVPIPLQDRGNGFRLAMVQDKALFGQARFVFACSAQLAANAMQARVLAQVKFGPPDKLRDLVLGNLPGVPLAPLPVAPRELPFHSGFAYFALEPTGELWRQAERLGAFALHVPDDSFPGLGLELWAIRNPA